MATHYDSWRPPRSKRKADSLETSSALNPLRKRPYRRHGTSARPLSHGYDSYRPTESRRSSARLSFTTPQEPSIARTLPLVSSVSFPSPKSSDNLQPLKPRYADQVVMEQTADHKNNSRIPERVPPSLYKLPSWMGVSPRMCYCVDIAYTQFPHSLFSVTRAYSYNFTKRESMVPT